MSTNPTKWSKTEIHWSCLSRQRPRVHVVPVRGLRVCNMKYKKNMPSTLFHHGMLMHHASVGVYVAPNYYSWMHLHTRLHMWHFPLCSFHGNTNSGRLWMWLQVDLLVIKNIPRRLCSSNIHSLLSMQTHRAKYDIMSLSLNPWTPDDVCVKCF